MHVSIAIMDNLYYFWTGNFEVLFRSSDRKRRNGFRGTVVCLPPPSSSVVKRQTGDDDDFVSWLVVFIKPIS